MIIHRPECMQRDSAFFAVTLIGWQGKRRQHNTFVSTVRLDFPGPCSNVPWSGPSCRAQQAVTHREAIAQKSSKRPGQAGGMGRPAPLHCVSSLKSPSPPSRRRAVQSGRTEKGTPSIRVDKGCGRSPSPSRYWGIVYICCASAEQC